MTERRYSYFTYWNDTDNGYDTVCLEMPDIISGRSITDKPIDSLLRTLAAVKVETDELGDDAKPALRVGPFDDRFGSPGRVAKFLFDCIAAEHKVSRLEIIEGPGRAYTNMEVSGMDMQYQDFGRTLKIFVG